MENWKKITICVAVFAFVREFRPIEPFYAAYMTSPLINCTVEQVMSIRFSYYNYNVYILTLRNNCNNCLLCMIAIPFIIKIIPIERFRTFTVII